MGKKGEINKEVLPYVAETITVLGMSSYQNGWKVLNINLDSIKRKMN
tara:strand:+ start:24991 stop:25131 length:141 start_codon:yes stop_codon:yes gene_type:complete